MKSEIRIVSSRADYEAIARLRYDVYVEEIGWSVNSADHERRQLVDDLDEASTIFAAFSSDDPIATGRVVRVSDLSPVSFWREFYKFDTFPVDDRKKVIFGKLMAKAEYRGSAVVPNILFEAFDLYRRQDVELTFLHCAPALVYMYEVLGCRRYMSGLMDPEVGFRIPMVMVMGDIDHFRQVRSPLLKYAEKYGESRELAKWFTDTHQAYAFPASVRLTNTSEFLHALSRDVNGLSPPLFEGMTPEEVQTVVRVGVIFEAAPNSNLIRQGDVGTEIFIILAGAVEISIERIDGTRRVLSTLGAGQFFGEGAFLGMRPRSADVTAIDNTRLLSISAEAFQRMGKKVPAIALKFSLNIARTLASRLYTETRITGVDAL